MTQIMIATGTNYFEVLGLLFIVFGFLLSVIFLGAPHWLALIYKREDKEIMGSQNQTVNFLREAIQELRLNNQYLQDQKDVSQEITSNLEAIIESIAANGYEMSELKQAILENETESEDKNELNDVILPILDTIQKMLTEEKTEQRCPMGFSVMPMDPPMPKGYYATPAFAPRVVSPQMSSPLCPSTFPSQPSSQKPTSQMPRMYSSFCPSSFPSQPPSQKPASQISGMTNPFSFGMPKTCYPPSKGSVADPSKPVAATFQMDPNIINNLGGIIGDLMKGSSGPAQPTNIPQQPVNKNAQKSIDTSFGPESFSQLSSEDIMKMANNILGNLGQLPKDLPKNKKNEDEKKNKDEKEVPSEIDNIVNIPKQNGPEQDSSANDEDVLDEAFEDYDNKIIVDVNKDDSDD